MYASVGAAVAGGEGSAGPATEHGFALDQGLRMGPLLDLLPPDVLTAITCLLEPRDLAAVSRERCLCLSMSNASTARRV